MRPQPDKHRRAARGTGVRAAAAAFIVTSCLQAAACGGDPTVAPPEPPEPEPDVPTALAIHAGDGQSATAGTAVANLVEVRVTGRTGAALADVRVDFAVTAGGGTIEAGTARTGSDGIASPGAWTLGGAGPQTLCATVAGLEPLTFTATAIGIPAEVVAVAGDGQVARVASPVPAAPEVLVTAADGSPLAGIRVAFATGRDAQLAGADSVTDASGRASAGQWTLGTIAGTYNLEATVEGSAITGNPVRFEARAVAGPAAEVILVQGDGQESEVRFPVPVQPTVRVLDLYGNVVAGDTVSFVAGQESAVIPSRAVTDTLGFAGVDKWVLGTEPNVDYTLTAAVLEGTDTLAAATFTAHATPPVYDIEIVFANPDELRESHRAAFENARQLWEAAIGGNLPWSTVREPLLQDCLSRGNINLETDGDRIINDLVIYASVEEIDGRGRTLAEAGPCLIRQDSSLPTAGTLRIDLADAEGLDSIGHLEGTIVHEMAHVLGFGVLWGRLGLIQDSSRVGRTGQPHFAGDSAVAAFARIGGERYTASKLVPVQGVGGPGVWNGHWNELVFVTELMTPFINGEVPNPLSIVTLASMIDLGYEDVDLGVADGFTLPAPAGFTLPASAGLPGTAIEILQAPLAVVDRNGNVVHYIIPR